MSNLSYVDQDPRTAVRIVALAAAVSINAAALISLSLPSPPGALLLPMLLTDISAVIIDPPLVIPPPPLPEPPPLPARQKPQVVRTVPVPSPVVASVVPVDVPAVSPTVDTSAAPASSEVGPSTDTASVPLADNGAMQTLQYNTQTPLNYPIASIRANEQGEVLLRVLVDANGKPERIEVARSSGHFKLDRAARESVQRWTFRPVMQNGVATPAWGLVPVQFNLSRG